MRIKKVEYIERYKLKLLFSNGKKKIVDLEDTIKNAKGIFLPLKKLDYFKKVSLDDCQLSICWPNGADICTDVLFEMGKDVNTHKKSKRSQIRVKSIRRRKTKQSV